MKSFLLAPRNARKQEEALLVTTIPDTRRLTIIPLTSRVCETYSSPCEPSHCVRAQSNRQLREVKWLAQGHTALTELSQRWNPSPHAQSVLRLRHTLTRDPSVAERTKCDEVHHTCG